MRIAQLVNNFRKSSPTSNHAIYSHASLLSDGLVGMNNDVTLFASGDSETKAKLFSVTEKAAIDMVQDDSLQRNYAHLLTSE